MPDSAEGAGLVGREDAKAAADPIFRGVDGESERERVPAASCAVACGLQSDTTAGYSKSVVAGRRRCEG